MYFESLLPASYTHCFFIYVILIIIYVNSLFYLSVINYYIRWSEKKKYGQEIIDNVHICTLKILV
jgi:hypothetical protein